MKTTVDTVKSQTDTVDTSVTALNNILNDITTRVDDVQTGLQSLQTRVDVLNNTEVTILKKADTLIANLNTFQDLQLRMEMEQNLAPNPGEAPLAILQLHLSARPRGHLVRRERAAVPGAAARERGDRDQPSSKVRARQVSRASHMGCLARSG